MEQADGSIVIDTELSPEGFKSGSEELLSAIQSLAREVKTLGKTLQDTFSGNSRGISETDREVQVLEETISSLRSETESLKTTITELEEKLKTLSETKPGETPVDNMAESAQAAGSEVTKLQEKVWDLENVIAQMQEELNAVFSDPASIDFDTNAAEEKIASLEAKISELESHIEILESGSASAGRATNFNGNTAGPSNIQKQVDSVSTSVTRLEYTFQRAMAGSESAMASFSAKAAELNSKINSLREQLEEFRNTPVTNNEIKLIEKDIASVEKKLESTASKLAAAKAGLKEYNQEMAEIQRSTAEMMANATTDEQRKNTTEVQKIQMDSLNEKYASQLNLVAQISAQYSELVAKQQLLNQQLGVAQQNAVISQAGAASGMEQQLNSAANALYRMQSAASSTTGFFGRMRQAAGSVFGFISKTARTVAGKLVSGIKTAASHMLKFSTNAKKSHGIIDKLVLSVKRIAPAMLMANGVIGMLRKAVNAYMTQNEQLQANLNACWTSLGNLLGPIIERVVNLVSTAVAYLTKFLNLLGFTGKSAKKQVTSASSAVQKETKKMEKFLASFDELERLGKNEDTSTDIPDTETPGEIEGVMPEVTLPDWVEEMIELLKNGKWADAAKVLTDKLNEMVDNVDWAGVGQKIAYWLNGALEFLATAITTFDWYNLGVGLGTLINNIIYGVDWANLGIVLGWKFIAMVEGLGGLFATIDWVALGKALSDAFMGLWNAIDWQQAAKTLSDGVKGILTSLTTAIENMNWQKIGNDIATFIANIDYSGIFSALCRGIGAALGGLGAFIIGRVEDAWKSVVDWWHEVAYEDGQFTMEGLLNGIWDAICNIYDWIVENIFNPFIEGFKAAFGINSPSTVMQEQGGFIIEGLFQGIKDKISTIFTWIHDNIFAPFIEAFKSLFGINSPSTVMQEQGTFIVDGLLLGLQTAWVNLLTWLTTTLAEFLLPIQEWAMQATESVVGWAINARENIRLWATESINNTKNWALTTGTEISKWIKEQKSSILNWVSETKDSIGDWSDTLKNNFSQWADTTRSRIESWAANTKENVKSWVKTTREEIMSWVSETKANIKNWATNVSSEIRSKVEAIKTTITSGFQAAKNTMVTNMQKAMESIKSQNWISIGTHICDGIADGLRRGWNWLIDLVCQIANSLYQSACRALGIRSPSRLFRDGVGLFIGLGIGEGIKNSESAVLDSVVGVADAIAQEFKNNEYSIDGVVSNTNVDRALVSFSDKIANSFKSLMDRMQAIAESTVFTVPKISAGTVVPYNTVATTIKEDAPSGTNNESIVAAIMDLLGADVVSYEAILEKLDAILQAIDEIEIGDTTIGEANQRYTRKMNVIRGVNA